ncbi:MAG: hypothetical protein QF415_16130 [Candidatus Undinarchaeales archaeon]|jgi:hypothetical protein|nr:hypothetical protein [Candidatus Undinarchaeales archaeon]MDP7492365.1 hypothetical protein [Candidatus Undinarchaeales archaeon]
MLGIIDRTSMPYESDVNYGTYGMLGAIGEQVAKEVGLEKSFTFNETTDEAFGGGLYRCDTVWGSTRGDVYKEVKELENKADELGIHATFESGFTTRYTIPRWGVVKTESVSKDGERGLFWGHFRYVDQHSFTVNEYGALPERFAEKLDQLEDTSAVKASVKYMPLDVIAYDLIDHLDGYADPTGNTAEILGLRDHETYAGMRELLQLMTDSEHQKINNSHVGKVPVIGDRITAKKHEQVSQEMQRKSDIIDRLEESLVE